MKFTDGYWQLRPGVSVLRPGAVESVELDQRGFTVFAPTGRITSRGDTLNRPMVTARFFSPADGVIGVTIAHHLGGLPKQPAFALAAGDDHAVTVDVSGLSATLTAGELTARVALVDGWRVDFLHGDRVLTSSTERSVGLVTDADGRAHVHDRLALGVGETVYGLGERFGAFVKNGQTVDIWNADGGTASEQAYKNVPFYLSSAGYGVFVDHPEHVSFEIGSEVVSQAQFSVEGQSLTYYLVDGPTPKDVLRRYTALTGRPARVPAWSYGLWLSTSFTTSYDEKTVTEFIDGMAERDLPLSVFHFDCFWMRQFHWVDFIWDPETFPDPEGMLRRLHERGLKVCVWINPYIAQRSYLFEEGRRNGYLVLRPDGSVWQWDKWQAGMALVDFTNPEAVAWYQSKLKTLLDLGVDSFKTDFGERIPTDVVWHDGSDPQRMHNYYAQVYNRAVFELLEAERGKGEAVVFARSATAGGQQFPVHWGGDSESTFASMAESLRGGLSLAASGFGYWSHDIGGFEGTPDPAVFKRWVAFGLLSSHSRLHGSGSYRVPWAFDSEAVDVLRHFTRLKLSLMPYLAAVAEEAHREGLPMMRPMVLEFPDDPTAAYLDRQYMLGPDVLVAPVMSADGEVTFYVPAGTWTHLVTGERLTGPAWVTEKHEFDSVPVLARPGAVIPFGDRDDRPDYEWADGVRLRLYAPAQGQRTRVSVPSPGDGPGAEFEVRYDNGEVTAELIAGSSSGYRVEVGQ
ncbi:alpha-D-xyloside xylohydrolase [Asanoa ferruginea]|uniref:alpha-D-xyloside xylohydrolase n=1 Tax=Asanoa ferruginea TaxID=53367 RepID=A0A3D9ZQG3_9ACTN|nr:alpha-xylosidase [Asanoa ferruginea]REF99501.1 alpha-D-xyloside xylohydrolase [Asanoa ferruginea]GIF49436.1 alpha-xylosidase [Asanoa ferruginea]